MIILNTIWTLFLIFLVIKAAGLVGWSWLWVFAPFWVSAGVLIVIVLFITTYYFFKEKSEGNDVEYIE